MLKERIEYVKVELKHNHKNQGHFDFSAKNSYTMMRKTGPLSLDSPKCSFFPTLFLTGFTAISTKKKGKNLKAWHGMENVGRSL